MSFRLEFGQDLRQNIDYREENYLSPNNSAEKNKLQQLPKNYNILSQSEMGKTSMTQMSLDMDNLFKMKEEYIFVFCKIYCQLTQNIAGFNEKFLTSVEVFDVTRGIWREFKELCSHRTKFQVQPINEDTLAILGGKDEVIPHSI